MQSDTQNAEPEIKTGDDRPSCYFESPNLIFRASGISSCPVRLAHIAMGRIEEHSESTKTAFALGHIFEEIIKARVLVDYGWTVTRNQEMVELQVAPNLIVRGHIDGVTQIQGQDVLFEAKSSYKTGFDKFQIYGLRDYENYRKQLKIYCTALNLNLAVIVFMCKETHMVHFELFNPHTAENAALIGAVRNTCERTVQEISNITNKKPSLCNEYRKQVFQCPFPDLHDDSDKVVVTDNCLEVLLDDLEVVHLKMKELTEQHSRMRKIVEDRLYAEGAAKVQCGSFWFQMEGEGREYTDYNAIRMEHPELIEWEEKYKKPGKKYLKIYRVKRRK